MRRLLAAALVLALAAPLLAPAATQAIAPAQQTTPGTGDQDRAIIAAVYAGTPVPYGYRVSIQRIAGGYARAAVSSTPLNKGEDRYAYLSNSAGRWDVLATEGSPRTPEQLAALQASGVPADLLANSGTEQAVIDLVRRLLDADGALQLDIQLQRIEADVARLYAVPQGGTLDPLFAYARLAGGQWSILGNGTAFDDTFYGNNAIPPTLQLTYQEPLGNTPVSAALPFVRFYDQIDGMRMLGGPRSGLITIAQTDQQPESQSNYAQIFEKGRIEYHPAEQANPAWRFSYGRLVAELIDNGGSLPAAGTSLSYRDLQEAANPEGRAQPPASGPLSASANGVFVPVDAQLRAAPGYYVPQRFWDYINRAELFPGGWLHDVGLPQTPPLQAQVAKNGVQRNITLQAFERAILTDDPQNPADFQIERANIGSDYLLALPFGSEDNAILAAVRTRLGEPLAFRPTIERVEQGLARVQLEALEQPGQLSWLFLRNTGDAWQPLGEPQQSPGNEFYQQYQIPVRLQEYNPSEAAITEVVLAQQARVSPEKTLASARMQRIAGGFARVLVTYTPDAPARPAAVFVRQEDATRWSALGELTTEQQATYNIPAVLRIVP